MQGDTRGNIVWHLVPSFSSRFFLGEQRTANKERRTKGTKRNSVTEECSGSLSQCSLERTRECVCCESLHQGGKQGCLQRGAVSRRQTGADLQSLKSQRLPNDSETDTYTHIHRTCGIYCVYEARLSVSDSAQHLQSWMALESGEVSLRQSLYM